MRIIVESPGENTINIAVPNWIVFNRIIALVSATVIKKHADNESWEIKLSASQLTKLFRAIRRAKCRHGKLELVSVESSDGEKVQILL